MSRAEIEIKLPLWLVALLLVILIGTCNSCNTRHIHTRQKIHRCHTGSVDDNDIVFWYVIMSDNGGVKYTYSSPTDVTQYDHIAWTKTPLPKEAEEESDPVEIDASLLPVEVAKEMEANATDEGNETEAAETTVGEAESASSDTGGRRLNF